MTPVSLSREQALRLREIAFRALGFVPPWIGQYDRFYIVSCSDLAPRPVRALKGGLAVRISGVSLQDIEDLQGQLNIDVPVVFLQFYGRVQQVRMIRIDEPDGHTVAVAFIRPDNRIISPSGYGFDLGEKQVCWFFGTHIHPRYRLRGVFVNLVQEAYRLSLELGTMGLMGEIHYMNVASIRAHARMGFKVYRNMHYLRILSRRFYWESPGGFWCL